MTGRRAPSTLPTVSLDAMACAAGCAEAVVSVSPGRFEERAPGGFLTRREEPIRAWCLRCCVRHGWLCTDEEHNQINDSAVVA